MNSKMCFGLLVSLLLNFHAIQAAPCGGHDTGAAAQKSHSSLMSPINEDAKAADIGEEKQEDLEPILIETISVQGFLVAPVSDCPSGESRNPNGQCRPSFD